MTSSLPPCPSSSLQHALDVFAFLQVNAVIPAVHVPKISRFRVFNALLLRLLLRYVASSLLLRVCSAKSLFRFLFAFTQLVYEFLLVVSTALAQIFNVFLQLLILESQTPVIFQPKPLQLSSWLLQAFRQ
ncbi:MAG: hypothetical protein AAB968_01525 [Patescibacteria group bacterium]